MTMMARPSLKRRRRKGVLEIVLVGCFLTLTITNSIGMKWMTEKDDPLRNNKPTTLEHHYLEAENKHNGSLFETNNNTSGAIISLMKKNPVVKIPKVYLQWQQEVLKETQTFSTTPYYALWNYSTQLIHIPNKRPGDPLTSLEILENVLIDNNVGNITEKIPSCLVPNQKNTQALVDSGEVMPLPVMNLGMPKCGSTTLFEFFQCAGIKSRHSQDGACIEKAIREGKPPMDGCEENKQDHYRIRNGNGAWLQMDIQMWPDCWFPQISFLDEIHQEFPNATFVMNFRPVDDWIRSARNWGAPQSSTMAQRWASPILCKYKIPGLINQKGRAQLSDQDLRNWLCGHVKHVREFVKQYPTHKLIELDLYNKEASSRSMASLFRANRTCWGKASAVMSTLGPKVPAKMKARAFVLK